MSVQTRHYPGNGYAVNSPEALKMDFIRDFGDAYLRFGLPRLMGHIVGLLLYEEGPLSLDEITDQLGVSKGPVSQVMSRLRDRNLVIRENVPGNRKDFYRAADDIFGQAFHNHAQLFSFNHELAKIYLERISKSGAPEHFSQRIEEMTEFYQKMVEHLQTFLNDWKQEHSVANTARRA